ncbi:hypothetical protein FUA48_16085 [Flavobacterium alkalisoli]|uniref:DUF6046 domain-containing protein n=1 Tax=Flavobacterium alkalisoli TaxID=2602769 RepID=A0A5B9FVJ8_9FLAO|nr:DUF6046 domain-containing protein [Flavobacterium alkalisoli]QEE51040.1 hypothetical protein FUA48_16085 [Flavobacterium alkalisoli]
MTQELIISLSGRYAAAFGFLATTKLPSQARVTNDYSLVTYPESEGSFEDIEFLYESDSVKFGDMLNAKDFDGLLAPPPLISFTQQKDLIETQVNGTDNLVIERWGTRPFDIRMRGLLIDVKNRTYPEDLIKRLYRLFKYNNVVDVVGTQFFDKDIKTIYFTDIEFNPVQGFEDTMQYMLIARSIEPVTFTLINPNA